MPSRVKIATTVRPCQVSTCLLSGKSWRLSMTASGNDVELLVRTFGNVDPGHVSLFSAGRNTAHGSSTKFQAGTQRWTIGHDQTNAAKMSWFSAISNNLADKQYGLLVRSGQHGNRAGLELLANCCSGLVLVPRRWGIPAASRSREIEVTSVDHQWMTRHVDEPPESFLLAPPGLFMLSL